MLQGLGLGPLLFVIYVDDLNECVRGRISMFADYAKMSDVVNSEEICYRLQQDLDQLGNMEFNSGKCKVIHFRKLNQGRTYSELFATGECCRTEMQGVQVHGSLKVPSKWRFR